MSRSPLSRADALDILRKGANDDVMYDWYVSNGLFDAACLALCSEETRALLDAESLTIQALRVGKFAPATQSHVLDAVRDDVNTATSRTIFNHK